MRAAPGRTARSLAPRVAAGRTTQRQATSAPHWRKPGAVYCSEARWLRVCMATALPELGQTVPTPAHLHVCEAAHPGACQEHQHRRRGQRAWAAAQNKAGHASLCRGMSQRECNRPKAAAKVRKHTEAAPAAQLQLDSAPKRTAHPNSARRSAWQPSLAPAPRSCSTLPGSCTVVDSICPLSVTPVARDCSTKLLWVLTRICS